jgi:hypothetical protein
MSPGWDPGGKVMGNQGERREQDPAEGARNVVDRELERDGNAELGADEATRTKARKEIEEQVKEQTELLPKGSA